MCIRDRFISEYKKYKTALLSGTFIFLLLISSFSLKNIEWTSLEGSLNASIIQTNLELDEKWSTYGVVETKNMMQIVLDNAEEGEIIVFPETALIFSENEMKDWLGYINHKAKLKEVTLITGIIEREEGFKVRNRILGLGMASSYYDKVN